MALKDLQSDLSKIRDVLDDRGFEDKFPSRVEEGVYAPEPTPIQGVYQDTTNRNTVSPIDNQIKTGVDFFDDTEGGAKGFVPKTNLESFYNKVQEGNVVAPRTHDGTYYADLNPIEGRKSNFRTNSGNYKFTGRGPNPPSQAYNDDIFYPAFSIGNQTTFYGIAGFSIGNQPAGNAYNSPFQPLPPYNFLNSPIANYVSSFFPDNPFSVTLGTKAEPIRGDTEYNNRTFTIVNQPVSSWQSPLIPNAHRVGDEWGYNLPTPNSTAGQGILELPRSIINDKRRGVFDHVINTLFEHQQFPINQSPNSVFAPTYPRFFNETSEIKTMTLQDVEIFPGLIIKLPKYEMVIGAKSIHISPGGELKAGLRYKGSFGGENNGIPITDNLATPWSDDFPQFKSDFMTIPIQEFTSNYGKVGDNQYGPSLTWGLGAQDYTVAGKINNLADVWPDAGNPTNFDKATPYTNGYERFVLEGIYKGKESIIDELQGKVEGFIDKIDELYKFSKEDNTFLNVPAGIGDDNLFGEESYRKVANRGPFEGKDSHPLILRGIGNKWGDDDITADTPFDSALGGIVRGAPTFTGYIDRVLQDRVRIAKFMFLTSEGLAFTAKQVALQALNPTIESKMYNPLSTLSIVGANDLLTAIQGGEISGGGVAALGRSIASLFFQIGHPERHLGNGRYENVINSTTAHLDGRVMGRIRLSAQPFGYNLQQDIALPLLDEEGGGLVKNFVNKQINKRMKDVEDGLLGAAITPFFIGSNPNKYAFPISSAPKSITNGVPSFVGGADLALKDVVEASTKPGGTFNKSTSDSVIKGGNNRELITRHSTLAYNRLKKDFGYVKPQVPRSVEDTRFGTIGSPREVNDYHLFGTNDEIEFIAEKRLYGSCIVDGIDSHNGFDSLSTPGDIGGQSRTGVLGEDIGLVKGNTTSGNVDKVNMIPLVPSGEFDSLPKIIKENPDFVKFNFKNVVENKYLVFRAILDGISDNVSPEYNSTRYIGRPDNLYTYAGTNRTIGFNFKVYPKTKQELPILMEKLNYLVGLCYPSYTEQERMITPFIELTIGDMFVEAPGLLNSLTVTVEDASTWEIEEGLQYPHFIYCACEFQYIGNYVPHNVGKHYDLSWLRSHRVDGKQPLGTFKKQNDEIPFRNEQPCGYINKIGGYTNQAETPPPTGPNSPLDAAALPDSPNAVPVE